MFEFVYLMLSKSYIEYIDLVLLGGNVNSIFICISNLIFFLSINSPLYLILESTIEINLQ